MVYVATRSCDHFKHTLMAFEAGKDVLLEKPATISYEQALSLYEKANKCGTPRLFVHQQRRLESAFNAVKEVIDSGKLGKVYEVNTEQNGFQHRDDWQTISEFGGGQLLNWGPHIVDHSIYFCGGAYTEMFSDIKLVTAVGDAEDHIKLVFKGVNGRVVDMEISGGVAMDTPEYVIYGTRGALIGGNN